MKEAIFGGIVGAVISALCSFGILIYQQKIEQKQQIYAKIINEYGDATYVDRACKNTNKLHWYQLNSISTHLELIGDTVGSSAVKDFYEEAAIWGSHCLKSDSPIHTDEDKKIYYEALSKLTKALKSA